MEIVQVKLFPFDNEPEIFEANEFLASIPAGKVVHISFANPVVDDVPYREMLVAYKTEKDPA